jgi:hypothetical protein
MGTAVGKVSASGANSLNFWNWPRERASATQLLADEIWKALILICNWQCWWHRKRMWVLLIWEMVYLTVASWVVSCWYFKRYYLNIFHIIKSLNISFVIRIKWNGVFAFDVAMYKRLQNALPAGIALVQNAANFWWKNGRPHLCHGIFRLDNWYSGDDCKNSR